MDGNFAKGAPFELFFTELFEGCEIVIGDALSVLKVLSSNICRCCITSPPYWGLRDYGIPLDNQIGAELSLNDYINNLTDIFSEKCRFL